MCAERTHIQYIQITTFSVAPMVILYCVTGAPVDNSAFTIVAVAVALAKSQFSHVADVAGVYCR